MGSTGTMNLKVIGSEDGKYMAWIGGSILGTLATFPSMLVTKAEYAEHGINAIESKCF